MLNLCRLLVTRDGGVSATVVVTEEWLGLLGSVASAPRVRFETIPNVIPSEHGRAADMVGFLEAVYTRMAAQFERLLDRLPPPAPAAIVADMFLPWAVDIGKKRGVPVCVLCPISATMFAVQYNFHRLPPGAAGGTASPVTDVADSSTDPCLIENYIPSLKSIRLSDLLPVFSNATILGRVLEAHTFIRRANGVIFTSFHEFEGSAIDALRQDLPCSAYAIGPCIPFMALQEHKVQPGRRRLHGVAGLAAGRIGAVRLARQLPVSVSRAARRDRRWPGREQGHVPVGGARRRRALPRARPGRRMRRCRPRRAVD